MRWWGYQFVEAWDAAQASTSKHKQAQATDTKKALERAFDFCDSAIQRSSRAATQRFERLQRLLGKLNTAPSRTPALGQRCVMVLRLV